MRCIPNLSSVVLLDLVDAMLVGQRKCNIMS